MHKLLKSKGNKPRKGKVFKCDFCKNDVYKRPCHSHRKNVYCNRECQNNAYKRDGENKRVTYKCKICKKEVEVVASQLKLRNRVTCSKECLTKYKRKEAEKRRKTYSKHQLDRLARYSIEAKEWRTAVFERDNYTCQWCGMRNGNGVNVYLEADHIKPFAYFPELRYELSNGRTLCKECHKTTKMSAKAMKEKWGFIHHMKHNAEQ